MTGPGDAEMGEELRRRNADASLLLINAAYCMDQNDLRGTLYLQRVAERALRPGAWLDDDDRAIHRTPYVPPRRRMEAHAHRREMLRRELYRRNATAAAWLVGADVALRQFDLDDAFRQQKRARQELRVGLMLRFGAWLDG